MIDFGQVANQRFTEQTKALQLQVVAAANDNGEISETGWADAFGPWCLVAVPSRAETDVDGNVKAACEALVADVGDQRTVIGTRDVRIAKYAQDLEPGEFALINELGFRLFFGKKTVSLTAGGGYLSFDIAKKKLSISAIPSVPGGAAPYLSADTDSIGLVSATGAASIAVKANGVTVSGASIALDAGRVDLGKNADDPVVTHSQLEAFKSQMIQWLATHVHPGVTAGGGVSGTVAVPPSFTLIPGKRVFAPRG